MSKKFQLRKIKSEPIYNDVLLSKFINYIMKKGKKFLAGRIVYQSFDIIKKQTKENSLEVFKKALDKIGPLVEVRPRRVGGATYQVPIDVKGDRKTGLAMRWLIDTVRKKKGKTMSEKLAQEIILAAKGEGDAVKKRINVEKMAAANRSFAYLARVKK
jgi:small subunit ribosomal protein S7